MRAGPVTDYLAETLRRYPELPEYALWRAIELRMLGQFTLPEPILDLGCGDGSFASLLFGPGKDITGMDVETPLLPHARATGVYREVLDADATRLPFADGTFASILSNCVLEHIPDDAAAVREMGRVLRPGGTAVVTVPSTQLRDGLYTYKQLLARGDTEHAEQYRRDFDTRLQHHHYHSVDEWRELFAAAHMEVQTVQAYLPEPVVSLWDRLENYLLQPIYTVLSHKKLALIILLPTALRRWLTYRFLRRYYLMETNLESYHGALLLVARKA
ncbi:MAG: class I SAM-dependent methyltransferase [Armatimonadia bacterium]